MTSTLTNFATQLRETIEATGSSRFDFTARATELYRLQFAANPVYRRVSEAAGITPETLRDWRMIPAMPTAAFKEFEVTCLAPAERVRVFHSSGTTGQEPSRHFHCVESLAVYQASLWQWFTQRVVPDFDLGGAGSSLALLTPLPEAAPHSSLVHMFETIRVGWKSPRSAFLGSVSGAGEWTLDFERTAATLRQACATDTRLVLLGTAFAFVHLVDFLAKENLRLKLPPGSRAMETGGYKGRSRTLPRADLHALMGERLGIPPQHVVCEYGMSELSSQAYDCEVGTQIPSPHRARGFRFPPWARAQIVSPETGRELAEGEAGLIRVFDLANVWSVMAIQTEDLGVWRGEVFELIGRARRAEPRGCSLLAA